MLSARKWEGPRGAAKGLSLARRAFSVMITTEGRSVAGVEVMAAEMSGMERGVPDDGYKVSFRVCAW